MTCCRVDPPTILGTALSDGDDGLTCLDLVVMYKVKSVNWNTISRSSFDDRDYLPFLVQRWATVITGFSSVLSSWTKWNPWTKGYLADIRSSIRILAVFGTALADRNDRLLAFSLLLVASYGS